MSLSRKGGVKSKGPREGVVTTRVTVDEWGHGASQMNHTVSLQCAIFYERIWKAIINRSTILLLCWHVMDTDFHDMETVMISMTWKP